MPQEILGGTKVTAKPRKPTFGVAAMRDALAEIARATDMETGESTRRRASTQPSRAPSQRSQALAAKAAAKSLEVAAAKVAKATKAAASSAIKKAATRLKKPTIARRLPVVKEEESVRRKTAPPKHPTLTSLDENTIVKRNLSDVINYEDKEDYVNSFIQLFNDYIPRLRDAIGDHSMNKMEDPTPEKIGLTIVQLTDDLYFTIRDKLINEVRPTSSFQ